jgi:predicted DNA-binding ribbon-helix-helix protein
MGEIGILTPTTSGSVGQSVLKRSIMIAGHKTSISLEDAFWKGLRDIAAARGVRSSDLLALVNKDRHQGNLSSHIRLFVLEYYQAQATTLNAGEQIASSTTTATAK